MPLYVYEALNRQGEQIREQGVFDSTATMYRTLKAKGLTLINYRRLYITSALIAGRRLKRLVAAEFLRNLAMILKGGVPLLQALEDFLNTPLDPVLKRKLQLIYAFISDGYQLSEAMEEAGGFSDIVVVLARIGEESGNLDRTLHDAATHLENIQDIINRTRSALTYPLFVLSAMTGALAFWLLYIFPQMLELFKSMGITELPAATRLLVSSVAIVKKGWPVLPVIVVLFVSLRMIAQHRPNIKYYWDLFWMKMPLCGRIIRASQYAFFFEYLSLLTGAGIAVVKGMEIMANSLQNQVMRDAIGNIRQDVVSGTSLTDAFKSTGFFEHFIIRLISVGEQTGNMPEQLKVLADFYLKQVRTMVKALAKTIEPAMIVLAGAMFVLIAMALLGPIYDLITRIQ